MYNIFRLTGDGLHCLALLVLFYKMNDSKSCRGISLKTAYLYAMVFSTRYLDLITMWFIELPEGTSLWEYTSVYNTILKIVFLSTSFAIIYLMKYTYKHTYDIKEDTFRMIFLVVPCFVLACFINYYPNPQEILWTFSIYLESVAIMPQLFLLQKTEHTDVLTWHYVFCMGMYRAFYLLNWVWRYMTQEGYSDWIVWVSGIVQTVLYLDFFYYYIKCKLDGTKLALPQ